jgi:hypothetical protein
MAVEKATEGTDSEECAKVRPIVILAPTLVVTQMPGGEGWVRRPGPIMPTVLVPQKPNEEAKGKAEAK